MRYVGHLIENRTSLAWEVSQEQQDLLGVEIESAAATLRHWRACRTNDEVAIAASNADLKLLREREADALANLMAAHPRRVVVVHDGECEIDRHEMLAALKEAWSWSGPCWLALMDVWLVLLLAGADRFESPDCGSFDSDEKPSVFIPDLVRRGSGSLRVLGVAGDPPAALSLLKDAGYFQEDSGD